jgi:hypothetical protein
MSTDGFHTHFGPTPDPKIFTSTSIEAAPDSARWKSSKKSKPGLGSIVESLPEGSESGSVRAKVSLFFSVSVGMPVGENRRKAR